jgi:hypothetical protein
VVVVVKRKGVLLRHQHQQRVKHKIYKGVCMFLIFYSHVRLRLIRVYMYNIFSRGEL